MAMRWRSILINAVDVSRLAAFWEIATGLRRALDEPDEVVLTEHGRLGEHPGVLIVRGEPRGDGAIHVDVSSDDLDADLARLIAAGATVTARPSEDWAMLLDPEGNRFCLRGAA